MKFPCYYHQIEVKKIIPLYQNFRNFPARVLLDRSLVVEHRNLDILLKFSEFRALLFFRGYKKAFDLKKAFFTLITHDLPLNMMIACR